MLIAIRTTNKENWLRAWNTVIESNASGYIPYLDPSGYHTKIIEKWSNVTVWEWENPAGLIGLEAAKEVSVAVEQERVPNSITELLYFEDDEYKEFLDIMAYAYRVNAVKAMSNREELVHYINLKGKNNDNFIIASSHDGIKRADFFDHSSLLLNSVGLITAEDTAQLSWMIFKGLAANYQVNQNEENEYKNYITLPGSSKKLNDPAENTIIYSNEPMMLERLNELTEQSLVNSFFISTHGTEDCIALSDSIVCGQSKRFRGSGMDCKINQNCPIHKRGILAADIPANFVINSTCFGYRPFDSILPSSVTLSNAFLDNCASVYISSVGIKHGPEAEICLLHNLLLHGYSGGNAVELLNNWLNQTNIDFPCYLVIGNPNQKYKSILQIEESLYTYKENEDSTYRLTIKETKGKSLVKIKLDPELDLFSIVENTSRAEFYYCITVENHQRYLYLYSWEKLNRQRIELILHKDLSRWDFKDHFTLSEIEKHIVGSKMENRTSQLSNLLQDSAKLKKAAKYDPGTIYKLINLHKKIEDLYSQLNQEIIEKLYEKASSAYSIFLPEIYINQVEMMNHTVTDTECFICSNRSKEYDFRHLSSKEVRKLTYCPRCGCISDKSDKEINIEILGKSNIENLGTFMQEIKIQNHSNTVQEGFAFLTHLNQEELSSVNKTIIPFKLKPGESLQETFEFEIKKQIQPSIYYFKAMAISTSKLYYSNKPIFFYKKASI